MMGSGDVQTVFLELDTWGGGMAPLLKCVEPFGKWSIDKAPTTAERALDIAVKSHDNEQLMARIAAENTRLTPILEAS